MELISVNFRFHVHSLFMQQTLRKEKNENKYAVRTFIQEKTKQDTRKCMMNGLGQKYYGHSGVVSHFARERFVVRNKVVS